jgi:hypothetical protein
MDKDKALEVIEQALNAATLKGVYNLNDVATILNALIIIKGEN